MAGRGTALWLGGALAVTAVTTAGCISASAPPDGAVPSPITTVKSSPQAPPMPTQHLQFPNTTVLAVLTGYNVGVQMVTFRKVVRPSQNPAQSVFDYDPQDPATYQLPLANGVVIHGNSSGDICGGTSGNESGLCLPQQLRFAVDAGTRPVVLFSVDGADHIVTMDEQVGAVNS